MKGTFFVAILIFIGVKVDVGVSAFEEKLIGADGALKPRYDLYRPNLEEYCEADYCRNFLTIREEEEECKKNEVFHKANETNYCGLGCPSGCYCKPGYVRLKKREPCVPVEETDKKCKKNEIIGCGKSDCQPYCDIGPDPLCSQNNFDCRLSYHCFCKPGYIRIDGGACVKPENCLLAILSDAVEEKEFKPAKPQNDVPFLEKVKIGGDL